MGKKKKTVIFVDEGSTSTGLGCIGASGSAHNVHVQYIDVGIITIIICTCIYMYMKKPCPEASEPWAAV